MLRSARLKHANMGAHRRSRDRVETTIKVERIILPSWAERWDPRGDLSTAAGGRIG